MKFFSKRHKSNLRLESSRGPREREIVSNELRNRLAAEISFISSRDDFLEFFILFENKKKDVINLDAQKVDGFSLSKLGYPMSEFFKFEEFAIKSIPYRSTSRFSRVEQDDNTTSYYYDDYKLFDLIEFIILFSKKENRDEVIKRLDDVLLEEDANYEVINGLITKKTGENISTIKNLISDMYLKKKLEDYLYFWNNNDYINTAKTSAEIINYIYSDDTNSNKKVVIEEKLKLLSKKLVDSKQKSDKFSGYLNNLLKDLKDINNNIYDIRHTEKSTILLNDENKIVYKTISQQNISFIEMSLIVLKDEYVLSEDWEKIKDSYIKKYQINKNQRFVIEKPTPDDDLPF